MSILKMWYFFGGVRPHPPLFDLSHSVIIVNSYQAFHILHFNIPRIREFEPRMKIKYIHLHYDYSFEKSRFTLNQLSSPRG